MNRTKIQSEWTPRRLLCIGGLTLLAVAVVSTQRLQGVQAQERIVLSVVDPRPMAAMADAIQKRLGAIVTYEDPRFEYPGDIEDVTGSVRRDAGTALRVLVPRGGAFGLTYEVASATGTPDPSDLLARALASYATSGYPGRFTSIESAGVFHIVPTLVRNRDGIEIAQQSVLETRITLPAADRTAAETIGVALQAVERATGQTIKIGTTPLGLLQRVHLQGNVSNELARVVLVRTLAATETKLSWQLLYGADTKMYFLNVASVRTP